MHNFEWLSVNHSDPTFARRVIPADIEGPDAPDPGTSNKQWGVIHIKTNLHYPQGFFRLHQLEQQEVFPELTLIVAKRVTTPPKGDAQPGTEYTYIQGAIAKDSVVSVGVKKIRAGDYYIIYKRKVPKKGHANCPKLNLIF